MAIDCFSVRNALRRSGARAGRACLLAPRGHDLDRCQEQQRQDDPRNDAGEKKPPDRLLGEQAVDDEAGARRKDEAQCPARCDRPGGEAVVIVEAAHFRERHASHGDRRGGRRAAQRREARAGDHRRRGEPAADVPDPRIGRVIEVASHAGGARHVAHQHEHRNDRELVEARDREGLGAERGQRLRPAADRDRAEQARDQHRQPDRHAQDEQREQPAEPDQADRRIAHSRLPTVRLSSISGGTSRATASTSASTASTSA